jgi:hypothetical protein
MRWTISGANSADGLKRAGQATAAMVLAKNNPRNIAMAKEFSRRKEEGSPLTETALMADIETKRRPPLKKTAACDAINDGLEKLKKSFGQGPAPDA